MARRLCGVDSDAWVECGGVGETSSSRHWFEGGRRRVGCGIVDVVIEGAEAVESGAMDWKIWMGSASKNSWATMKGVLVASTVCQWCGYSVEPL